MFDWMHQAKKPVYVTLRQAYNAGPSRPTLLRRRFATFRCTRCLRFQSVRGVACAPSTCRGATALFLTERRMSCGIPFRATEHLGLHSFRFDAPNAATSPRARRKFERSISHCQGSLPFAASALPAGAFHLDIQQKCPVASITCVPVRLLLQKVGTQKLPGAQRNAIDLN